MGMARKKKKSPTEYKKKLAGWVIAASICGAASSYILSACGKDPVVEVTVQLLITGLGTALGYLLATAFEKNSRNKYGVDRNGNPWENNNDEEIGG